ncbi:cytochrome P450 [Neobacillus sp. NPDC093127]|uniref:cytochrome P450 n=1 Tax=Neobacillus sp. NPDC093127 TaxID=3364296 RepID=UPI003800C219
MSIMTNSEISLQQLNEDPYPIYEKLRKEAPVCYISSMGRWLVTRWDDCKYVEENSGIFSAAEDPSMMTKAMGLTMLRQDGGNHKRLRMAVEQPLRPKAVRDKWTNTFREDANELINRFINIGETDLVKHFAGPFAGRTLKRMLALENVSDQEIQDWSIAFMEGMGNYNNDPAVWKRMEGVNRRINDAIDEVIPFLMKKPNDTILSSMVHSYEDPEEKLTIEEIRANVKLIISGGLNEPRDGIASAVWALLTYPDQRQLVTENPQLYSSLGEEAIRYIAPVGMYPRQVAVDTTLNGVELKKGERIMVCLSSANRDEHIWKNPNQFDITREKVKGHMAFSMGSHFCVGAWMARLQLAISLPLIMGRLTNLRLNPNEESKFWGFGFRGLLNLHVQWDI